MKARVDIIDMHETVAVVRVVLEDSDGIGYGGEHFVKGEQIDGLPARFFAAYDAL